MRSCECVVPPLGSMWLHKFLLTPLIFPSEEAPGHRMHDQTKTLWCMVGCCCTKCITTHSLVQRNRLSGRLTSCFSPLTAAYYPWLTKLKLRFYLGSFDPVYFSGSCKKTVGWALRSNRYGLIVRDLISACDPSQMHLQELTFTVGPSVTATL